MGNKYRRLARAVLLLILIILPFFEGGNSLLGRLLFYIGIPLFALVVLYTQDEASEKGTPFILFPLIAFLAYLFINTGLSTDRYATMVLAIRFAYYVLAFWLAYRLIEEERDINLFLDGLISAGLLVAAYGIFIYYGSDDPSLKVTGPFGLHNSYAAFLLLLIPITFGRILSTGNYLQAFLYSIPLIVMLGGLAVSFSRASWALGILQFLVLILFYIFLTPRMRIGALRIVPFLLLFVILAFFAFYKLGGPGETIEALRGHLVSSFNPSDYSLQGRLVFNNASLGIWNEYPYFGSGFGTFASQYPRFQSTYVYYSTDPHNLYLQLLAETGVVGLVIFFSIVMVILERFRYIRQDLLEPNQEITLFAGLIGVISILLHLAFDFDWTYIVNALYFFSILAVLEGLLRISHTPRKIWLPVRLVTKFIGSTVIIVLMLIGGTLLSHDYFFETGVAHSKRGDQISSNTRLSIAEKIIPWNADTYFYRAKNFLDQNPPSAPQAGSPESGRIEPPWASSKQENELRRYSRLLDYAISLNRFEAKYYYFQGIFRELLGEADAGYLYEKALELDKFNHPFYYLAVANYYARRGERTKFKETLERAVSTYKIDNRYGITMTGRMEWIEGDAVSVFKRVYELLSEVYREEGDLSKADEYSRIATQF